ncbi:MAG: murein hydrolase activator EnvC [Acetanaerobacterium sp.]
MNRILLHNIRAFMVAAVMTLLLCAAVPQYAYGLTLSAGSDSSTDEDEDTGDEDPASSDSAEASEKLDDLKDDYAQKQKELDTIKKNLDGIANEKEKSIAQQNSVGRQITLSQEQIAILQERVALLNDEIAQKEKEIADKQADIDDNYELFKVRVRALYMTDTSSVMNVLFGAQSFSEFLERSEYIKRITEHDDTLIARLREDKETIEIAKAEVDAAKAEVDAAKADEDDKKQKLEGQYGTLSQEVSILKKAEAEYNANKEQMQKELDEAKAEIDRQMAKIGSTGEFVGGDFAWPLPGYSSISSYYGWRFNHSDFHTGIDITGSGVYGASVKAANAGEVAFVQSNYTTGVGYGKYVIIDHGGGYATLYAHMSSISVSLGDWLGQGDKVGEVGSTGWSTGPHLHFEIRLNGQHTNPLNYYTAS